MTLLLKHIALFFIYLLLQVFVANHFTLYDVATPHIFLVFLLMMPMSTKFPVALLIAFFTGLALDLLSDGLVKGLHAFSGVFLMSIREFWVWGITNRANYRGSEEYMLHVQSVPWYVQYLLPLILLHQAVYYLLEAFSFEHVGFTLLKVVGSTAFTFLVVFVFTLLFHRETKR
jgi:hypothetical protein